MITHTKDPDASLRYGVDVAAVLASGDSLAGATIHDAEGVTAASAGVSGTVASMRVSGGTPGQRGRATLRWTTTQGDTDERTLVFDIQER